MMRYTLLCTMSLMLLAAGSNGRVTGFTRGMVSIYDQTLTFKGKEPQWKLAKGGVPIEDKSKPGYVSIKQGDRIVYLRLAEVVTEGLQGDCQMVTNTNGDPARPHQAVGAGISSGMAAKSQPCI